MTFFSLQNYSTFSMLSGVKESKVWTARAKEIGYTHLGICDKQTLGGMIDFQTQCEASGIKPILGCEMAVFTYAGPDPELRKEAAFIGTVLLYIKNETGFENLIYLNNYSHDPGRGFYYTPRIDLNTIGEKCEGLLCVTPSVAGVGTGSENRANETTNLLKLLRFFGDDFYLGLNPMLSDSSAHIEMNKSFAESHESFKKVWTFNAHYPEISDAHLYTVLRVVDSGRQKKNADREVQNGYLPEPAEVFLRCQNIHPYLTRQTQVECVDNLNEIAKKCDFKIGLGEYFMPDVFLETESLESDIMKFIGDGWKEKLCPTADFDVLKSFDELEKCAHLYPHEHVAKGEAEETLKRLGEYVKRIRYEYGIIKEMGFLNYFHIVRDITSITEKKGAGRGSAAGSLLSYLLNITMIDPIRHNLLFERFLNPSRKDLPDIDMDFAASEIGKVHDYVKSRYGSDKVRPIITYSRLKIASAVKDISAAYSYTVPDNDGGYSSYDYASISRAMKVKFVTATARGQDEIEERLAYDNFEEFYIKHRKWFNEVILPLQEAVVNDGIHAAGTVITHKPHDECLPLKYNSRLKDFVSQWRDRDCERKGYPKFDLLTIEALDVIARAIELIEKRYGVVIPRIDKVPLDDLEALDIFTSAKTDGIFQFNTFAQKLYLNSLKPTHFDELVAAVSLIRPGPMHMGIHEEYEKVKNGKQALKYAHPDLEPILGATYGFMIYQEQMMEAVKVIGGLTGAEAEAVRKACGKKSIQEMLKWEQVFKDGAEAKGYDSDFVDPLWAGIEEFASYSFNLSHAVSYTLLSYYQAWIKARYPVEYWAASLQFSNTDQKKDNSATAIKFQAEQEGIEFVYPTIESFAPDFEPLGGNKIAWPLSRIHGVGQKAVEEICKDGRRSFASMQDMFDGCAARVVNKRVWESLVGAGFFNSIHQPWDAAQAYMDLRPKKEPVPYQMSHQDMFKWYKLRNESFKMIVQSWKDIAPFHHKVERFPGTSLTTIEDGSKVFIGGYIEELLTKRTKRGDYFGQMTLVDNGEKYRVMLWGSFWDNQQMDRDGLRPQKGQLVELIGVKTSFNDQAQVEVKVANSYLRIIWK